jgi:antitoxin YefM
VLNIVPEAKRLRLSFNMPFAELDDTRGIARNVAGIGRWGHGEVEFGVASSDCPHTREPVTPLLRMRLAWTGFLYSAMTIETTYTSARDQLKALMDKVVNDREVVLVRRRQGGDVALVAADELEGLLETAHLLRSPRNAARLLAALERARGDSLPALRLEDLEGQLET